MATSQNVTKALDRVIVPGVLRSLVQLNLVREVTVNDSHVSITLASTALGDEEQAWLREKVTEVVGKLRGVTGTTVDFVAAKPLEVNDITRVIAIMSGKGGVGKSLITGLLATYLARKGFSVGVLDADITGPSIPKMFGLTDRPFGNETGIMPVISHTGIEVMSLNLLLPQEDEAVIWRGPMITNTIRQFWDGVLWGKLDYLLLDLPPGTADATLTVMQLLPLSGSVVVFSPQELASMIVRKVVRMSQVMNIPILGVVENMSYFLVPETGKRIDVFGKSRIHEMAKAAGAPLLGQIPIDPQLARLCDEGAIEKYDSEILNTLGEEFLKVADKALKREPPARKKPVQH
jgi:hydrogenase maturation protease